MLNNLKQREKILLVVALLLVLITVYYFYIQQPLSTRIEELERELIAKENQLALVLRQAGELSAVREEYAITLQRKEDFLDAQMSVTDLLIVYNDLARKYELDLADFDPQPEEEEIHIFSDLVGDFRDISDFFVDLNAAVKLELVEIRLGAADEEGAVKADFYTVYYK